MIQQMIQQMAQQGGLGQGSAGGRIRVTQGPNGQVTVEQAIPIAIADDQDDDDND